MSYAEDLFDDYMDDVDRDDYENLGLDEDDKSIADQIIDGEICAFCNMPFKEVQDCPVACEECWEVNCGYEKSQSEIISI